MDRLLHDEVPLCEKVKKKAANAKQSGQVTPGHQFKCAFKQLSPFFPVSKEEAKTLCCALAFFSLMNRLLSIMINYCYSTEQNKQKDATHFSWLLKHFNSLYTFLKVRNDVPGFSANFNFLRIGFLFRLAMFLFWTSGQRPPYMHRSKNLQLWNELFWSLSKCITT